MINGKWDLRFLELAKLVSSWSKDKSTKCGAVIVRPDKSIASVGFNGLPSTLMPGMEDELLSDRKIKMSCILHAEENCLLFSKEPLAGYTVYTYPIIPCSKCCSQLLQAGICRFVFPKISETSDVYIRWKDSFSLTRKLIKLAEAESSEYEFN